jgi:hypothetical protein
MWAGLDFFGAGEIGDGAADFEDPTIGASAQAQFVDRGFEQSLCVISSARCGLT